MNPRIAAAVAIGYNRTMEIFELLQFCGCLFDILTLGVDVFAGRQTYRYVKAQNDADDPNRMDRVIPLVILIAGALIMTALLLVKWSGGLDPNVR